MRPGCDPWLERCPRERKGYPLQYSGPENSMDCIVHEVSKHWTWLSDFHFHMISITWLLLGRKAMTNLDSILKSRDITLPTKVHKLKVTVFPIVIYGCESWTIKKAERQRIDGFELWCWRRLLRVPWTARRSNQSILKEISPDYSLEGLMLKLNEAPILWPPDAKKWLVGKDPDAGKDWRQEEKGPTEGEMVEWHHWLNGHEFE